MIRKNILILTLVNFFILLHSCECVVKPNCNGDFRFKILDKITGQNLVQGPGAKYSLDSIKILPGRDTIPPAFVYAVENILICSLNGPGDTLYLRLNASDTDTLLLSFEHIRRSLCCQSGSRAVTGVNFNGIQTRQDSLAFILQK